METMTLTSATQADSTLAPAIEITGLTKHYGQIEAVSDLSLQVPQGTIFGFLGPNGSGKTTTIRMILGLVRPTSGQVRVLGHDAVAERAKILPQVGAIVESPTYYGYLSGRENLQHHAWLLGTPRSRIDEVLEIVDLQDRAGDKVKTYSLGMKQRLGIAASLLNNPRLIMLDEPTNGLDPQGTADVRSLIRRLCEAGHTIFLSSHMMHEIEQICHYVAIINHGKLVVQGTVQQLLEGQERVVLEASPAATAAHVLQHGVGIEAAVSGDQQVSADLPVERVPDAVSLLVDAGVRIYSITRSKTSLEDYFLARTGAAIPVI
ncbi:MAG: ABC transporter ATP-binding protein [Chloroflexia bacterium]